MIHGIYVKNKPNSKWHLFSITLSQEAATLELDEAKKQAILNGNEAPEVGVHLFDSAFWIPEYMDKIQNQKILFN